MAKSSGFAVTTRVRSRHDRIFLLDEIKRLFGISKISDLPNKIDKIFRQILKNQFTPSMDMVLDPTTGNPLQVPLTVPHTTPIYHRVRAGLTGIRGAKLISDLANPGYPFYGTAIKVKYSLRKVKATRVFKQTSSRKPSGFDDEMEHIIYQNDRGLCVPILGIRQQVNDDGTMTTHVYVSKRNDCAPLSITDPLPEELGPLALSITTRTEKPGKSSSYWRAYNATHRANASNIVANLYKKKRKQVPVNTVVESFPTSDVGVSSVSSTLPSNHLTPAATGHVVASNPIDLH